MKPKFMKFIVKSVIVTFSSVSINNLIWSMMLNEMFHIEDITTRAHQRASLILRCFKSRDSSVLFKAFVMYVRPLLEYNCQIWSPYYISVIRQVESVPTSEKYKKTERVFQVKLL